MHHPELYIEAHALEHPSEHMLQSCNSGRVIPTSTPDHGSNKERRPAYARVHHKLVGGDMTWFGSLDAWLDIGFAAVVVVLLIWITDQLGNGGGKGV